MNCSEKIFEKLVTCQYSFFFQTICTEKVGDVLISSAHPRVLTQKHIACSVDRVDRVTDTLSWKAPRGRPPRAFSLCNSTLTGIHQSFSYTLTIPLYLSVSDVRFGRQSRVLFLVYFTSKFPSKLLLSPETSLRYSFIYKLTLGFFLSIKKNYLDYL